MKASELKNVLRHVIRNNRKLEKEGKPKTAIEIKGESGLGKTSVVHQLTDELKMNNVKLSLGQVEELGDIIGFPNRQFEVCRKDECLWIDEQATDSYIKNGFEFTGNNRMTYCVPEWIQGKHGGGVLLLDDWNRADPRMITACMELILHGEYISWKLPPDWHIILTANPDDSDYAVNTLDKAQRTRFITLNLDFDKNCWAEWAEENKLDGRCINFLLANHELVDPQQLKGKTEANPRAAVNFFNAISSIEDFAEPKSLVLIQLLGEGSVGESFTNMFTTFINQKLDKLISPQEMLLGSTNEKMVKKMNDVIGWGKDAAGKDKYRSDIAAILAIRFKNFVLNYAKDHTIDEKIISRVFNIISKDVFHVDQRYLMARDICNGEKRKFNRLIMNSEFTKYL